MGEQAKRAVIIVSPVKSHYALKVGERRSIITSFHGTDCPAVEGIGMIGARRDGFVETLASLRILLFIKIEVAQLFEVSWRRIIHDHELQLAYALAPRESSHRASQQGHIRRSFDKQVGQRSDRAADKDDPQPIVVGPPPRKMHQREDLQNDAPGI